LTPIEKIKILRDVSSGLQALHLNNVVHRNVKTQNVLLMEKITNETDIVSVKLGDYGEVYHLDSEEFIYIKENIKDLDEFDCLTEYNGTIQYAPSEILQGDLRLLTTKADIYSFGILIWEIFTERIPFDKSGMDLMRLCEKKIDENLTPLYEKDSNGEMKKIEYLPGTPKEIEELVNKCLSTDPQKRPSIDQVCDSLLIIHMENKYIKK